MLNESLQPTGIRWDRQVPSLEFEAKALVDLPLLRTFKEPTKRAERSTWIELTGSSLIENPSLLPHFLQTYTDTLFIAQANNDSSTEELLKTFVTDVDKYVGKYDWKQQRDTVLTPEQARAILSSTRQLPETKAKKRTKQPQDRLIEYIAKGYLDTCFKQKGDLPWEKALDSLYIFLQGAAFPEPDLSLLTTWHGLIDQQYPIIMNERSLAVRALGFSSLAVDDAHITARQKAEEMSYCKTFIEQLSQGRIKSRSDIIKSGNLPFDILQQYISQKILEFGFDPRQGKAKEVYRRTIMTAQLSAVFASISQKDRLALRDRPIADELITLSKENLRTPENKERYAEIERRVHEAEPRLKGDISLYTFDQYSHQYTDVSRVVSLAEHTPVLDQVTTLLDHDMVTTEVEKGLRLYQASKSDPHELVSFNFGELSGYMLARSDEMPEMPQQQMKLIQQIIEENGYLEQWRNKKFIRNPIIQPVGAIFVTGDEKELFFTRENLTRKTQVASYLDLRLPSSIRQDILRILNENAQLREELPNRFRRMPTRAGDHYGLQNHEEIPRVINNVLIGKRAGGGLFTTVRLMGDAEIFGEGQRPQLGARVDFLNNLVNIHWEVDGGMSTEQRTIMDHLLLELVAQSCCPIPQQIEEERQQLEQGGINPQSLPGLITHVGGWRKSGERKQPTVMAEHNFAEVVQEMYGVTGGISLARINEEHHEAEPEDDRFLTYSRGRDIAGNAPVVRATPETFFTPQETL